VPELARFTMRLLFAARSLPNSADHFPTADAVYRLETHLDRHPDDASGWLRLCNEVADTRELCTVAEQYIKLDAAATHPHHWSQKAERAREVRETLIGGSRAAHLHQPAEPDVGLEIDF
jgi:hypothetical protein